MIRAGLFSLGTLGMIFFVGCSQGPPKGTATGKVTMNGKPVTGAMIKFENRAEAIAMQANLDAEGKFEIKSFQGAGLPVGTYQVTLVPGSMMTDGDVILAGKKYAPPPKPNMDIPKKYTQNSTTDLKAEVRPGTNDPFHFDLMEK